MVLKSHFIFSAGLLIEEDFLAEDHFWSEFNQFRPDSSERKQSTLGLQITGENILILHNPSKSNEARFAAAQFTESFTMSTQEPGEFEVRIKRAFLHLRDGGEFPSPISLQSTSISAWLLKTGFRLIASEEELCLERGFITGVDGKQTESITAESRAIKVVLSRDVVSLLRTLVDSQNRQVEEAKETSQTDSRGPVDSGIQELNFMEAALSLDIRNGSQQSDEFTALDGKAWFLRMFMP